MIAHFAIWFMVVLSLAGAVDYFWAFWSKIDKQVSKRQRRRTFVLSRRKKQQMASTSTETPQTP
jgi:CDP-diacylglycerol--glycerol-3-phosphate 3-phosphatidyltransferase